jgi:Uma2 family endonuclease
MSQAHSSIDPKSPRPGEPVWQLATMFPRQGTWSVDEYLQLDAGRLVEFDNGTIEVLEMPTLEHQRVVQFLYRCLFAIVTPNRLGEVFVAPLPVRLWEGKYREPDVIFLSSHRQTDHGYPDGADLVIEVVSDDAESRRRDLRIKPPEYARAGVREYWIVDPRDAVIIMHRLTGQEYSTSIHKPGEPVASGLIPSFNLLVDDVLAAAQRSDAG